MAGYLRVNKTVTSFNEIYQLTSDEKKKTLGTAMVHYDVYDKARTMAKDNAYHTHTPDQIGLQYAGLAVDAVGSVLFLRKLLGDAIWPSQVVDGSLLSYSSVNNGGSVNYGIGGPPGSWACAGYIPEGFNSSAATNFRRVL